MGDFTCDVTRNSPVWNTWDVVRWKGIPESWGSGRSHLLGFKDAWVRHNRLQILEDAGRNRFPALLLAGICWNEVAGDPQFIDGVAHTVRSFDWSGPDWVDQSMTITRAPEYTSFGAVSMQLRTAAETLGMDIASMSFNERQRLANCLEVDVFNIGIAADHIRILIDHDGLQARPPALSDEELKIAASRYNRGLSPSLESIRNNLEYGEAIMRRQARLIALLA